ncbi:hypothetical protein ACFSS8_22190 [Paracoccus kondratievae]
MSKPSKGIYLAIAAAGALAVAGGVTFWYAAQKRSHSDDGRSAGHRQCHHLRTEHNHRPRRAAQL